MWMSLAPFEIADIRIDVHQLDDRRFLALAGQHLGADLLEVLHDLDVAVGVERRHLVERRGGDFEGALAGAACWHRRRRRALAARDCGAPTP